MPKALYVLRHEVTSLVGRFSFWFGVLGIPLLSFLAISGVGWYNRSQGFADNAGANPLAGVQSLLNPQDIPQPQGYVDPSGLIRQFPDTFDSQSLVRYSSAADARQAMLAGKISAYYVIPADYVESGKLYAYTLDISRVAAGGHTQGLRSLIDFNLLGGDAALARAVSDPLANTSVTNLAPDAASHPNPQSMMGMLLPYGVMMLLYITIMGSASLMLNSIVQEKGTRMMEVLMASVTPHELLLGKITGLGLVGLLQVAIWGGSGFALLRLSGQTFNLRDAFLLRPSILVWGLVFFVLGYMVYASLMAGAGALVPDLREGSQAALLMMLPLTVPFLLISGLIDSPNGWLAVTLSLFPPTASITMMLRLATTQVPLWQLILAAALLALTALWVVRMVARMFRAQALLSGQPFRLDRFARALLGKG